MESWIFAPNLTVKHGFSTRYGGISVAPFDALNVGGQQDTYENVVQNRRIALGKLGIELEQLAYLKQIHSDIVRKAEIGQLEGDALVTNEKNIVLAVSIADCYPVLLYDAKNQVIGAAHCGWRGTVAHLAGKTALEMVKLGAELSHIQAAIGQGISQPNFEVGEEVVTQFAEAGFPSDCWQERYIDLAKANQFSLEQAGIPAENIWRMNRCTYEPDFFSYRRDKGITGRMWAVIMLT